MASPRSTQQFTPGHSRAPSDASSLSSPITSTFSVRAHSRWPSNSSLATSPDSPATLKSQLDDLVEEDDDAEKDDVSSLVDVQDFAIEPLCICDTIFCEHRQSDEPQSANAPVSSFDWDDESSFYSSHTRRSIKRSRSGDLASRFSRRWPSISSRWRDIRPTTSVTSKHVRSAPPSRHSSGRRPSLSQTLSSHLPQRETIVAANHSADSVLDHGRSSSPSEMTSRDILPSSPITDPIDREGLSSTPLLPPLLSEVRHSSQALVDSPEHSPRTATNSSGASTASTTLSSPVVSGFSTPPLSAKPSMTSIGVSRHHHAFHPYSEGASFTSDDSDCEYWAARLGHANFDIDPKPYLPDVCNRETCARLLDDWEAARIEFMRVASRVSEHHGPTSRTFKLTTEKWMEIDKQWRSNLDIANAEARANGESPTLQSLAETQPMAKMPSLIDPEQFKKILVGDENEIVGPMVQYNKIQSTPSKKPILLRILTNPASLFGAGRSAASSSR